jgi:hypothetical protein
VIKAMEGAKIDSPRGKWTLSKAHNPVQDIYLRKVVGKENKVIGVGQGPGRSGARLQDVRHDPHRAVAEPPRSCPLFLAIGLSPPGAILTLRGPHGFRQFPHPVAEQRAVRPAAVPGGRRLTLIFGIMGVINLAHGSFYMIGAYLAWSLAP